MHLQRLTDNVICWVFPITLDVRGCVGTIASPPGQWRSLIRSNMHLSKIVAFHHSLKQKQGKTLRDFLRKFNKAWLQTKGCSSDIILATLISGVWNVHPRLSIWKHRPTSFDDLLERIYKYIVQEMSRLNFKDQDFRKGKEPTYHKGKEHAKMWNLLMCHMDQQEGYQGDSHQALKGNFTPLSSSRSHVLNQIRRTIVLHRLFV